MSVTVLSAESDDPLFRCSEAKGTCQVMCFHPWSDITLARMSVHEIRGVIDKWTDINTDLGHKYAWVQVQCLPTFNRWCRDNLIQYYLPNLWNIYTVICIAYNICGMVLWSFVAEHLSRKLEKVTIAINDNII